MNVKKIADERPKPWNTVTVKTAGNVIEVRYAVHGPPEMTIQKLNADEYVDFRTGAVERFQHAANRAGDKASVAQSLRNLRDMINVNLERPETALWVTLTYRENMTNPVQLYEDYRRFWQRFKYYLNKHGYPSAEYIIAAEPQGRGAWHLHCLFLFPGKAPYIANVDMAQLWGHGFTKTKSLKGVDNPGLYLTAYLGDMEITEAISAGAFQAGRLAEAETEDKQGQKQKKAVIKGARLHLYPNGFNLYRCSRGVKRPDVQKMTEREARKIIGNAPLTYEKTIAVTDSAGETVNVINCRQYNRARQTVEGKGEKLAAKQRGKTEAEAAENGPKGIKSGGTAAHH